MTPYELDLHCDCGGPARSGVAGGANALLCVNSGANVLEHELDDDIEDAAEARS